jgi:hypothetical protein
MSLLDREFIEASGEWREGRFNTVLRKFEERRPWWYLGTYQASTHHDVQGVDFVACIIYPKTRGVIEVPIQVKPSTEYFDDYYRKHPYAKGKNIVEMSVCMNTDVSVLANNFKAHLQRVRANRFEYRPYFVCLQIRDRSEQHHLKLKKEMAERREKSPLRLPPCRSPSLWIQFWWWLNKHPAH